MKLKKVWPAVLAIVTVSMFFSGCPTEPEMELEPGQVYTAGYSSIVIRAYYWVDDQLQTIAEADQGIATKAACVVPTTFGDYVAGARTDFVEPVLVQRAILWFNGKGEFLDDKPSFAFAAVLHDGKIFAAGWRDPDGSGNRPCVWEVSDTWTVEAGGYVVGSRTLIRHDLLEEGVYGEARDIAVSGSDIYVCGIYYKGMPLKEQACVWKNGQRTDLTGGTWSEVLCVDKGTVYVGGKTVLKPCYWVNDEAHEISSLPPGSSEGMVTAIAARSDGLFLGGSYWDGSYYCGFTLHKGTLTSGLHRVIGAASSGEDIYLGCDDGWYKNGSYTELPWIGGTLRPQGLKMRLY